MAAISRIRRGGATTLGLALLLSVVPAAVDVPYLGTWKLDVDSSDLVGGDARTTIAANPGGEYTFTDESGRSYLFKLDGRDYPDPYGASVSWKQLGDRSWQATNKVDGKVASTDAITSSTDGKVLTIRSRAVQTTGNTLELTQTLERIGVGTGFVGTWKAIRLHIEPYTFVFKATSADAFDFSMGDLYVCTNCKFDGKSYPVSGTQMAAGTTVIFKKTAERSFQTTFRLHGNIVFDAAFTVSGDGTALTESGGTPGGPRRTWVFRRQ